MRSMFRLRMQDDLVSLIRWSSIVDMRPKGDRSSWMADVNLNIKYLSEYWRTFLLALLILCIYFVTEINKL